MLEPPECYTCPECLAKDQVEYVYENIFDKEECESIIRVCQNCGRNCIIGERCNGEEFIF